MYLCYVDESGDAGTLNPGNQTDTPVFVVASLIVDQARLSRLTHDLLTLRQRFYPTATTNHYLDTILNEVKGETVRKAMRKGSRRNRTHAIGYLDGIMSLAEQNDLRLVSKALVKGLGQANSDAGFYGSAIMHVCRHFNAFLLSQANGKRGHIIADSRRKAQNSQVSHTIFTQMFRAAGNSYPRLTEMPTYGHSNNHAMIQITDTICSGILFPMLTDAYCTGLPNVHVSPQFTTIRGRYKRAIQSMQYRYQAHDRLWHGGLLITDGTGARRNATHLFR